MWGGDHAEVRMVAPANGGLTFNVTPQSVLEDVARRWDIPMDRDRVVLNPRGLRPYVRMDAYIDSVKILSRQRPNLVFVFADASPALRSLLDGAGIADRCRLIPRVPVGEIRAIYALASLIVSPTTHDGTPINLVGAMWAGAVPIAGDIPSIREWITTGHNGTLVDPNSANALAEAMSMALDDPAWRLSAARRNREVVERRAGRDATRIRVAQFYEQVASSRARRS
jgi:glycosyltransferase involved in cell wall biosynthesis